MEYVFTEHTNGWGEWYATDGEYFASFKVHGDGYFDEVHAGARSDALLPGESMTVVVGEARSFFRRAFPLLTANPDMCIALGIDTTESVLT